MKVKRINGEIEDGTVEKPWLKRSGTIAEVGDQVVKRKKIVAKL